MNTAQARQDIADRAVAKMRAEGFDSAQKREDWRRDGSMTRKIISDKEAQKFGFYVDENGDHIPYGMD